MITGHRQSRSFVFALLLVFGVSVQAMDKPSEFLRKSQGDGKTFIGLVESVLSGDQLQMRLTTGETILVTLAGIKAPSEPSPYARLSQQWLSSQLKGQLVSAECNSSPSNYYYCAVFPDDRQINLVSLYHGFSICSGQGSLLHDAHYYKQFEAIAKSRRAGLWQLMSALDE